MYYECYLKHFKDCKVSEIVDNGFDYHIKWLDARKSPSEKWISNRLRCNVNINFAFILILFAPFVAVWIFFFFAMLVTRRERITPTHHNLFRTFMSLENINLKNNRRSVNILSSLGVHKRKCGGPQKIYWTVVTLRIWCIIPSFSCKWRPYESEDVIK